MGNYLAHNGLIEPCVWVGLQVWNSWAFSPVIVGKVKKVIKSCSLRLEMDNVDFYSTLTAEWICYF